MQNASEPERALTRRQQEVLELVMQGLSNKAIAAQLGISVDTVRRTSSRIKQKLAVPTTSALACLNVENLLDILKASPEAVRLFTPAELQVVAFLCQGLSSKEIARAFDISSRTVDKHREHILCKLGVDSTRQVTAWVAGQYAKSGLPDQPAKP
jgi:DNA-binding NarL/FixJ family response regulator